MPFSIARRAAPSALIAAAYGVLLREPLNPASPALPQEMTAPWSSVMVTIVLLNVAWICACPAGTFFRSRRRVLVARFRSAIGSGRAPRQLACRFRPASSAAGLGYFLRRTPTVFLGPRRCRALVLVRCPRTGRLRR